MRFTGSKRRVRREPEKLEEILTTTLKRLKIAQRIDENKAVLAWPEVVGKKIAQNATAEKIKEGTLFIKTSSAAWSCELSCMRAQLIDKLNAHLEEEIVKGIRFRQK
ncbi:MAG: DUF721 domain-containing protein [Actinobacteria bacterium]|nr:MAG: DUF721 domain-containing protein [Actinomycetota bacterium]